MATQPNQAYGSLANLDSCGTMMRPLRDSVKEWFEAALFHGNQMCGFIQNVWGHGTK